MVAVIEICDHCGDEFAPLRKGSFWWIKETASANDTNKIYFCGKCSEEVFANWTTEEINAYTIECGVCGAVVHAWHVERNMVRVQPGVFVCEDGKCHGEYEADPKVADFRGRSKFKMVNMANKIEDEREENSRVLQNAKGARPLVWKPRDTDWLPQTEPEPEVLEVKDIDYEKEFPYLNYNWSDGEKVEWFEEHATAWAEQHGHVPFVKSTGPYNRTLWCYNCKEEIILELKAHHRLPTSNGFGGRVPNIKETYLMDTIAGDLLEKRCERNNLKESYCPECMPNRKLLDKQDGQLFTCPDCKKVW